MFTLLLPLVLLLYGEFSNCGETRFISRVLLYSLLLSWYAPSYFTTPFGAGTSSLVIMSAGLCYAVILSQSWIGRAIFSTVWFLVFINYYTIVINDYTLAWAGWYINNSHFILRELLLIGITTCTKFNINKPFDKREAWITYLVTMMYLFEWFVIR